MNNILFNTDKAYLVGLLIGGGNLGAGGFTVTLPYQGWGDMKTNPKRAGEISKDILQVVNPLFQNAYGIGVSFAPGKDWVLSAHALPEALKNDLKSLGLPTSGDLRLNSNLLEIVQKASAQFKKAFVFGLADSIGSLAASHRRFSNDYQVVSLEFSGFNFELVAAVTRILVQINCVVDQVLWNHPNQHAGDDRYYGSWKKGMKIRVMLRDFGENAGFGFSSKVIGAADNLEKQANPLAKRTVEKIVTKAKCLHVDENSTLLPQKIRGKHFLHWQHIAAEFKSETVDSSLLKLMFSKSTSLVSPFTLLSKGTFEEVSGHISSDPLLEHIEFKSDKSLSAEKLLEDFVEKKSTLLLGSDAEFDLTKIAEAIAYPLLASVGETNGKRYKGNLIDVSKHLLSKRKSDLDAVQISRDLNLVSPIFFRYKDFGSMSGPISKSLNEKFFEFKSDSISIIPKAHGSMDQKW